MDLIKKAAKDAINAVLFLILITVGGFSVLLAVFCALWVGIIVGKATFPVLGFVALLVYIFFAIFIGRVVVRTWGRKASTDSTPDAGSTPAASTDAGYSFDACDYGGP